MSEFLFLCAAVVASTNTANSFNETFCLFVFSDRAGILVLKFPLSAAMACTNPKGKLSCVAPCTVGCKMHVVQLLTAVTSLITQKRQSYFICGKDFETHGI